MVMERAGWGRAKASGSGIAARIPQEIKGMVSNSLKGFNLLWGRPLIKSAW